MDNKTIVCLANSWREQGRCIAGKEVKADGSYGEWVRPVGSENSEQIENAIGSQFSLLDIITIPMKNKQDKIGHQTENWVIDKSRKWEKIGNVNYSEALKALDQTPPQWVVEGSDSSKGKNDTFSGEATSSLGLIRVENFSSRKEDKYRANFSFNAIEYDLSITDVKILYKYRMMQKMDGVILCISLIGALNKPKTKLIAGVITPNIGN